jgi:ADP-ribosylation factor GTPase-activating protein 1
VALADDRLPGSGAPTPARKPPVHGSAASGGGGGGGWDDWDMYTRRQPPRSKSAQYMYTRQWICD